MNIPEAIVLGIIQGLTEFLPISSSGHLELMTVIMGGNHVPEESLLMTVVLHAATALSTLVIFRKSIAEIIIGLLQFKNNEPFRFSVKIILSMIPAAAVGLLFDQEIESLFGGHLQLVGAMLLVTGLLLFFADKAKNTTTGVNYFHAILIGISQAIAILPGISRSGATISTSVLLGVDRTRAARFSFLMVVPLILGKMAKDILSGEISSSQTGSLTLLAGFAAAFISGFIACLWMIRLVQKSKLKYFSYYCFAVGTGSIIYSIF